MDSPKARNSIILEWILFYLLAALSLRSFDSRRQYPADLAG